MIHFSSFFFATATKEFFLFATRAIVMSLDCEFHAFILHARLFVR